MVLIREINIASDIIKWPTWTVSTYFLFFINFIFLKFKPCPTFTINFLEYAYSIISLIWLIIEFLIIFLAAAKAKGISYFKNLSELNKKESPRLLLGSKILNMIGIKTKLTKKSIKIYGDPNLKLNKKMEIKNFFKDHRIMALSTIAALTLGGKWKIHNPESIKTSFPSFLKILKDDLGAKINWKREKI